MLPQKIAKRFIGQFLQRLHAVQGQSVQGMPRLAIEFDALPHGSLWALWR
jgi:hypothetical protein